MRANHLQTNFLSGEWSKFAQGRMEDVRYKNAMARCYNSIPIQEGCVVRRPGTAQACVSRFGVKAVSKKFSYKESRPYTIELTAGHARVVSDGQLLTDTTATISSVSVASPMRIVLSSPMTSWASDDIALLSVPTDAVSALAINDALGRQVKLARIDSSTFDLYDMVTGAPITGSVTSLTGASISRVLDLATPYTEAQLDSVRVVQSETDMILLHHDVPPQKLSIIASTDAQGTVSATFEWSVVNFLDGPYLDPFTNSLVTPSAVDGIITLSLGFTAYSATKAYSLGDYTTDAGIAYKSLINQNVGNTPASTPAAWVIANPGDVVRTGGFNQNDVGRFVRVFSAGTTWTWGKITALATTGVINPTVAGTTIFGDMTDNGGVAAMFDGNYSQVKSDAASKGAKSTNITAYVGLHLPTASEVASAIVYPLTDGTFGDNVDNDHIVIELRGSTSAPSNWNDGTLLATTEGTPVPNSPVTLVSSDATTTWNYVWIAMRTTRTSTTGITLKVWASETVFYNASGQPGSAVSVQVLGPALASTTPATWRLGTFGGEIGYPSNGCYHEGRLWLSGTIDNRFDASKSNDVFNMEPTSASGVVADNNAISYTLNASDVNPIFWMSPGSQGISMGSQGGEWLVRSGGDQKTMTPTAISATRVSKYECANIEPAVTGISTVFVQSHRRRLLEFISDIYSGKFFGPDLNEFAKHISKTGLQELASQEELAPIVWSRRGDGRLVGVTYRRVSMYSAEPPKFLAWHQHDFGHGRKVVSMSSGPANDSTTDTIMMVTRDDSSGVHYLEYMTDLYDEGNELWQNRHVDGAVTPACGRVTNNGVSNVITLYGLSGFEGDTVDVVIGGVDCGSFLVSNGQLSVPLTGDVTREWLAELTNAGTDYQDISVNIFDGSPADVVYTIPCTVGFTYTSQGQMVRPNRMEDTGVREGPALGKRRRSHALTALLTYAKIASWGTAFDKMRPMRLRNPRSDLAFDALFSGVIHDTIDDGYSYDSQPCWEVTRPWPFVVNCFGASLSTEEN